MATYREDDHDQTGKTRLKPTEYSPQHHHCQLESRQLHFQTCACSYISVGMETMYLDTKGNYVRKTHWFVPIERRAACKKLQHHNPKAINITFNGVLTGHCHLRCTIARCLQKKV
ncbi:heat shock protein [Striga asiatica]|uniref:Heat shock protein n=1 Tax=Striga asiatica TaxID=4170 RepID=A0A5A7RBB6_STRAF|nr:heat shock protein [Striga asiatica]